MGSSTNYRFEMRTSTNPARDESETLSELIHLCDVPTAKITAIKEKAQELPIHNEYPGYNCQDYVLELLDELEEDENGIINGNDQGYMERKEAVRNKQEGLA